MKILLLLIFTFNSFAISSVSKSCREVFTLASGLDEAGEPLLTYSDPTYTEPYDIFIRYNHPALSVGHKNFLYSLKLLASDHRIKFNPENKSSVVEVLNKFKGILTDLPSEINKRLFRYDHDSRLDSDYKKHKALLACMSVSSFLGCKNAVLYLINEAQIKRNESGNEFIFSDLFEKVLTESSYERDLVSIANALVEDSIDWVTDNKVPDGNIYDLIWDITRSKSKALEILGTYSIRSAAIYSENLRYSLTHSKAGLSLLILSSFISYFDKVTYLKNKTLFSLPWNEFKTACQYGKPYHFWMAAYMSHIAKDKGGYTSKQSYLASHLLGVGYELAKKDDVFFNGRASYLERIINAQSTDDINVQNAKIDIFFNTLGAKFGVSGQRNHSKSVDGLLIKLLNSGDVPDWFDRLSDNLSWFSIVDPNQHVDAVFAL